MRGGDFSVAILGGGCLGSSILYELTARGHRNIVLVDNARKTQSATSQSGGMLRVFHERPEHLALALENFEHLARYRKRGVLKENDRPAGSLYFYRARRRGDYASNRQKMERAGYPFEVITADAGRRRFPAFNWREDEEAIYEPAGSQLSPLGFVEDLRAASRSLGAALIDDFEVCRISRWADRYRLSGRGGTVTTKMLVLAGGARLLPRFMDLGIELPLRAVALSAYWGKKRLPQALPNFFDRETLAFGRLGSLDDVVLSQSRGGRLRSEIWEGRLEKRSAPDCYAPDRLGLLGELSGFPQLILATGWGGTGFKFALAIAKRVADALERGKPREKARETAQEKPMARPEKRGANAVF
jgi:glycine/D-amino acid oxidase-like deaminating enzyme